MTTDEIFVKLPNFIIGDKNKMYFFSLIKGSNRIHVEYKSQDSKYLRNTRRSGKTLQDALLSMYNWLVKFEYINE